MPCVNDNAAADGIAILQSRVTAGVWCAGARAAFRVHRSAWWHHGRSESTDGTDRWEPRANPL